MGEFILTKKDLIARNQGHFEPANNYQRYIVLNSGTIEHQGEFNIQYGGDHGSICKEECFVP